MNAVAPMTAEERALHQKAQQQIYRRRLLANYDSKQLEALDTMYQLAHQQLGTGGGNAAAQLLLGLYNGSRFPFDLTELRRFDAANLKAAMAVIHMDSYRTHAEIHVVLEALYCDSKVQSRMEIWAADLRLKGKASKEAITELRERLAA